MTQNLQRQLDAIVSLKSNLEYLRTQINELSTLYKSKVDAMVEEGLPIQIYDTYTHSYLESHLSSLNNLMTMIEDEDIQYINRNIEALEEVIARSGSH